QIDHRRVGLPQETPRNGRASHDFAKFSAGSRIAPSCGSATPFPYREDRGQPRGGSLCAPLLEERPLLQLVERLPALRRGTRRQPSMAASGHALAEAAKARVQARCSRTFPPADLE